MFHQALSAQATKVVSFKGNTVVHVRVFVAGTLRLGHDPVHLQDIQGNIKGGLPITQVDCVQVGGSVRLVWSGDLYAMCDGTTQMIWVLEFDPAMIA